MIAEFEFKECRICGGDIQINAETCPLCSSRQRSDKIIYSTKVLLFFAVLGFICIMFLGIMSAHAIQQFICKRTTTCNEQAILHVTRAKISVENYVARYGRVPENLTQVTFQAEDGVSVILQKAPGNRYRLISFHDQGDNKYFAFSGNEVIFFQKKGQPTLHSMPNK